MKEMIEANAQVNTQDKVCLLLTQQENTVHNTSSYTVLLHIAVLGMSHLFIVTTLHYIYMNAYLPVCSSVYSVLFVQREA